ncbi:MAG: hypothetical protein AB1750_06805 [Chloroflexota bacterium]
MSGKRFVPEAARRAWRAWKRAPLAIWVIPYEPGLKLQRFVLSQSWVQRLFFSRQVRLVQTWAELCSCPDQRGAILGSLMNNTMMGWRSRALQRPDAAARWLKVEGAENFQQALASGRGIILLTLHTPRTGLIPYVVQRAGGKAIHRFAGRVPEGDKNILMATYVRQIIEAQTLLQQGEVVVIGGDGLRGVSAVNLPFYGRLFPFRSGFADLAARANASALAVFVYYETDGRVIFEFSEAIRPGEGTREAQVEGMAREYARILIERWPRLLPSLMWRKLRQILAMPAASER